MSVSLALNSFYDWRFWPMRWINSHRTAVTAPMFFTWSTPHHFVLFFDCVFLWKLNFDMFKFSPDWQFWRETSPRVCSRFQKIYRELSPWPWMIRWRYKITEICSGKQLHSSSYTTPVADSLSSFTLDSGIACWSMCCTTGSWILEACSVHKQLSRHTLYFHSDTRSVCNWYIFYTMDWALSAPATTSRQHRHDLPII